MRIFIWIAILYCIYFFLKKKSIALSRPDKPAAEETFLDPVCGTYVSERDAVVGRLGEKRIRFCSIQCLEKYRDNLTGNPEQP